MGNNYQQKNRYSNKKYATTLFAEFDKTEEINKNFAKLCYHRSAIFSPHHLPFLSLGTVVKSTLDNGCYYICIQQRCDSVRIQEGEMRRFLFISLDEVNDGGFNFLTPNGIKLKIDKSTYSLRTVKFSGTNGFALATRCEIDNKNILNHLITPMKKNIPRGLSLSLS